MLQATPVKASPKTKNGADPMRSAPSSVRSVFVNKIPLALVIITAILLSYAPPAYPQQFFVYTVSKIESEEISSTSTKVLQGGLCLLGTFQIENPLLHPFCLWITLKNSGKMVHERSGSAIPAVGLKDLFLHYKSESEAPIVKKFSDGSSNADGHAYEVFFRSDDMQLVYEVELWGYLTDRGRAVTGGVYAEKITFDIERIQF